MKELTEQNLYVGPAMNFGYLELTIRCKECGSLLEYELRGLDLLVNTNCKNCGKDKKDEPEK